MVANVQQKTLEGNLFFGGFCLSLALTLGICFHSFFLFKRLKKVGKRSKLNPYVFKYSSMLLFFLEPTRSLTMLIVGFVSLLKILMLTQRVQHFKVRLALQPRW